MRPTLLMGSSEKACYDKAFAEAQKGSLKFLSFTAKDYPKYEKFFYSGNLEGLSLFYISEAESLSYEDAKKFIEMISASPHFIILSATQDCNWFLKKSCNLQQLSLVENELSNQLRFLMFGVDRNVVRDSLEEFDILRIFHILKFGAYQSPASLDFLVRFNQYIYKVSPDYLRAMLIYGLPVKPYLTQHKKHEENPMQISIKKKLHELYPKLAPAELADVYLLAVATKSSIGAVLTDEEKSYLKIEDVKPEEEVFAKTVNLGDYF